VVLQLLNLIQPQRCYFGQKDAQQLVVLQKVIRDLYFPVGLIPCATLREVDGLALSSRNRYLSPEERAEAPRIYRGLCKAKKTFLQGESDPTVILAQLTKDLAGFRVEYASLVHPSTLQPLVELSDPALLAVAVHLGTTRLIDNIRLTEQQLPIIAIDGPAGSGKSTVARLVAQQLEFTHLDTGAMYRAVTWAALQKNIQLNGPSLTLLAQELDLKLKTTPELTRIWINGSEVTHLIRSQVINAHVSTVAAVPGVRQVLVAKQQQLGQRGGVVMEGRDIGSQVFPQAEIKIFLTASPAERARRRALDLERQGETPPDLETLAQQILQRDYQDAARATAPLIQAPDALLLNTDGLTIPAVVDRICGWAKYL
jgi:pantoate ligase/cytidylate kinase